MEKSKASASGMQRKSGRWKLFLIIGVCAAPMMASYFTYYVIKPAGRANYGVLLDPRRYPIPQLGNVTLEDYKGRWLMLQVAGGDCNETCRTHLFAMRQLRLMQGKDMERIERVWLITDTRPLDAMLMREYDGTGMLRVDAALLKAWLPTDQGTMMEDHLYLIDPLGNLMMRFPRNADPNKMKKDISRLLRASAIG